MTISQVASLLAGPTNLVSGSNLGASKSRRAGSFGYPVENRLVVLDGSRQWKCFRDDFWQFL
jgi:hypothetical protein